MILYSLSRGAGLFFTTIDHADIRGLVAACLVYVVELPLTRAGSLILLSHSRPEDSPVSEPRSACQKLRFLYFELCYAGCGTTLAIAHINAANSRAIAVMTI